MMSSDAAAAAPAPRVLLVAEHTSMNMGGEAARPLHYFKVMRRRGVEAWMLVHARTRDEIKALVPEHFDRFYFVPDTFWHKLLWQLGRHLPHQLRITTFGALSHLVTQVIQKRMAREIVRERGINLVHEPIPISPKQPSMTYDVGAPVVIGPLNGNINYPPAFGHMEGKLMGTSVKASRVVSNLMNRVIPGKLRAHTIIVSNRRTRDALPGGYAGRVVELVANAVDMSTWKVADRHAPKGGQQEPSGSAAGPVHQDDSRAHNPPARFAFLGRLVDFKMVDLLLEAFAPVAKAHGATLDVIGDGEERPKLEALAKQLGLADAVTFAGWMSPKDSAARLGQADVLVFPSLRECGGAVVMEAMAVGLPVIAADWGGPADYVGDDGSGILVKPDTRASFVAGLTESMTRLAASHELREQMSRAARRRAVTVFDWEARVDRLLEIYADVLRDTPPPGAGALSASGTTPALHSA